MAYTDPYGRRLRELAPGDPGYLGATLRAEHPPGVPEGIALLALAGAGAAASWSLVALSQWRIFRMRLRIAALLGIASALVFVTKSHGEEPLSTLRLDGLSYISFEGGDVFAIPSGSTIGFRFGAPTRGTLPFTIQPSDVSIAPIEVGDGSSLQYGLASPASGSITRGKDGAPILRFSASVKTTANTLKGSSSATYSLAFTTESATARSADGRTAVEIEGMKLVEGARYLQLVGAATNRPDADKQPGAAVSSVLSGTFDRLPPIP